MIPEGWICLKEVGMDYEADIIIGFLGENNVSAVKHYPGAGEYLKLAYGMASSVRIYIAKEDYAQGKALLAETGPSGTMAEVKDIEHSRDGGWQAGKLGPIILVLILVFILWAVGHGTAFLSR